MEVGRAFSAPFKDPKWFQKALLGVVFAWIPLVNLAVVGWGMEYLRRVANGRDEELPGWDAFGDYWARGLGFSVAAAIYYLPAGLIFLFFTLSGSAAGGMMAQGALNSGYTDPTSALGALGAALSGMATGLMVAGLFALVVSVLM
ncbi:MAG: DUF4013 domain-containing protein, partial [Actinobacteria bacterium]